MKFNEFLTEKGISTEQFSAKGAEEMAALYNEYNEKVRAQLAEAIEAKATKEDIEALKSEIRNNTVEQMKSLNEVLKQHGVAIKKLTEAEKAERGTGSFADNIRKGLELNKEALLRSKDANSSTEAGGIRFKAVGDMTIAGNVSGGNVPVEQRIAGMDPIASRRIRLMDIVARGTASSNVISWVSQAGKEGAAGGTAEGTAKNQIDFDLVVASETVKKRTAFIKASTEMLGDIDFIQSEINNELMRDLLKDVENQVYQGDGTGTNLNGIRTVATAFAAGTFAGTVDNANFVDVLRVAMDQIKVAEHDAPNFILAHPSDVTALKLIKTTSTDKRYIDALQLIAGQLTVDGVPIIESTLVTAGEYLIGAFDMATVYDKGEVMIEVGLDGNDFTNNMRTIIAEWRGAVVVKTNMRSAFVKGVIATDAAALETL